MLGDHLLGEIERLGEGVDGGRAEREFVHHGAARWIGQGRESQAECIHNRTVVYWRCGVKGLLEICAGPGVRGRESEADLAPVRRHRRRARKGLAHQW